MIAEIIATPQISLKLYKSEANVIIEELSKVIAIDPYTSEVIDGVIKELNKINEFEIKL